MIFALFLVFFLFVDFLKSYGRLYRDLANEHQTETKDNGKRATKVCMKILTKLNMLRESKRSRWRGDWNHIALLYVKPQLFYCFLTEFMNDHFNIELNYNNQQEHKFDKQRIEKNWSNRWTAKPAEKQNESLRFTKRNAEVFEMRLRFCGEYKKNKQKQQNLRSCQ